MTDKSEPHSALFEARDRRTTALEAAIASIRQLPHPDSAAAEAMAPEKAAGARSRFGRYASKLPNGWQWLLGITKPRKGEDPFLPCDDHVEYWQHEDGRRFRISHPYHLHFEEICQLVDLCRQYGLEFEILPGSWYYPGSTVAVVVTPRGQKAQP